jgi:hypothetical protein
MVPFLERDDQTRLQKIELKLGKNEKLTKRKSLYLCWKLWEWLAQTGVRNKYKWPEWNLEDGNVRMCEFTCPCCEYATDWRGVRDCKKCPLKELWRKIKSGYLLETRGAWECDAICGENKESPYHLWERSKSKETRIIYATIIAKAAKKEYFRLTRKLSKNK